MWAPKNRAVTCIYKWSEKLCSLRNRSDRNMRISGFFVLLASYVSCITQTNQMLCKSGLGFYIVWYKSLVSDLSKKAFMATVYLIG